ncbi:hypothetical protein M378DRAFT_198038 [Amanita muscaria Koide BX008]|uniref:Uncharacterized protein n=1 Tax=Amanita muscaria (strain Koide BX008) TaxID=946122 RepID=A0A0C2TF28_AMAMK|nr:hypothetical protein M378DRAFT_198038 [Amanita muscaria Koide BX008]
MEWMTSRKDLLDLRPDQILEQRSDIRGKDNFQLDTAGFFVLQIQEYAEKIKNYYYAEQAELVKELMGASKVIFFEHTMRRTRPGLLDNGPDDRFFYYSCSPTFAPEASGLLNYRFQIINLRRPIDVLALQWPLALCDYRSVDPKIDVLPIALALIFPDGREESFPVKYNPKHKRKYTMLGDDSR